MSKRADDRKGDLRQPWLLTLVLLVLAMAGAVNLHASGRLKIVVAGNHQTVGQLAKVTVTNAGNVPVTVCMACCGSIIDAKADSIVPDFEVQIQGPRGWGSNLLWGCDVGSCFTAWTLAAGQTQEFRLKLAQSGTYRLRLYYVDKYSDAEGPKSVKCPNIAIAKHHKNATSNIFVVSGTTQ